jgi:hypothetical protein
MALKNPFTILVIVLGLASAFAVFADGRESVARAGNACTEMLGSVSGLTTFGARLGDHESARH